jgi:hypothetical protein
LLKRNFKSSGLKEHKYKGYKMKKIILAVIMVLGVSIGVAGGNALATTILPGGSGTTGPLVDLGSFGPGIYDITGTGIIDLIGSGGTFSLDADGKPVSSVTAPGYSYFNPTGSDQADGIFGAAGSGVNLGAIIGTFSSNPTSPTDWFLIGSSTSLTIGGSGVHIYASFNDTYHQNNVGSFEVTVTPRDNPVPEPATMLLLGVGLAGFAGLRIRKNK